MKQTFFAFALGGVLALAVSAVSAQDMIQPYYPPPPPPPPTQIYLDAGDVITSINGRPVYSVNDFLKAVNSSRQVMYFTVQDNRTGRPYDLATRLDSRGYRMGVYVVDNGGYGVRVTGLMPNSAAYRCWMSGPMPGPVPRPVPAVGVGVGVGTPAPGVGMNVGTPAPGVGRGIGMGTAAPQGNYDSQPPFTPMNPGPVVPAPQYNTIMAP